MTKNIYTDFDYAAKTAELEETLAQLQSNDVSLDDAIRLHEKGKALIGELEGYLQHAEVIVRKQVVGEVE